MKPFEETAQVQSTASQFLMVGERTNITGSPRFAKSLKAGDWNECLAIARQQVESGANILDLNVDEELIDGEATMVKFLNLIAAEPDMNARVSRMFAAAFARPPSGDEATKALAYLAALAREANVPADQLGTSERVWQDFAQSLFNLKEFIYVR